MESATKRTLFLAVTVLLALIILVGSVVVLLRGPRESSVEFVEKTGSGELVVNDLYEGQMTIPDFDIPECTYKLDDFSENHGVITYGGGDCFMGINVNAKMGDIDWAQVADSGVDFVMIRVGFRNYGNGRVMEDERFTANIEGALAEGLPVGVYFYSKAVNTTEAEEEATFVLDKIRTYNVTYPVCFYWKYDLNDDGTVREDSRISGCNGDQITDFTDVFCSRVRMAGYRPGFYCEKAMGYERLDLVKLKDYDMWYSEFKTSPSFYYDFKLWQYTDAGSVSGISEQVPITLAFKKYGN